MEPDEDLVICGSNLQEISASLTRAMQASSPSIGKKLRAILLDYVGRYDTIENAFSQFNNRTVRQIIAEYRPSKTEPLASGEMDGFRWTLHDRPPQSEPDSE